MGFCGTAVLFSFSKKRNFACVEEHEDMNYEATMVKVPPCPKRMMRRPLPAAGLWSAQERTAIAKMELHVNNSDCVKLEIDEVEVYSLDPEYSDVDVKHMLRNATREGGQILKFSVFESKISNYKQVAIG